MNNTNSTRHSIGTLSTRRLVICSLFAAILCISAYLSIPTPLPMAPKITLMNFMVLIIGLVFSLPESLLIGFTWLILGIVGLPVFVGAGSGVGYLLTPYGGYTWAFPIVMALLPLIRGKEYKRIRYTVCAVIGVVVIDIIGMLWLMASMHYNLQTAFIMGFVPFIPLDAVKAVIAAQIIPALRRVT